MGADASTRPVVLWTVFVIAAAIMIWTSHAAEPYFSQAYPPSMPALDSPLATRSDFTGVAWGFRRFAADIAWVETLQYYGTHEGIVPGEEEENGGGHYPLLLDYCERVSRLDPHFVYVYYYGGGSLCWNLKRMDEAEKLIRLGIFFNPAEWRLPQYLAAMAYQKHHDPAGVAAFLMSFVYDENCPPLLRALLANLLRAQGRYAEAIDVWKINLGAVDASERHRARVAIQELVPLAIQKAHSRS